MDEASVQQCREQGISAIIGDALNPPLGQYYDIVCFNLILHHLVADKEVLTTALQKRAMQVWNGHAGRLFVNEYIYDSYFDRLSGLLIYGITKVDCFQRSIGLLQSFCRRLR
jgi:hypothetical protein